MTVVRTAIGTFVVLVFGAAFYFVVALRVFFDTVGGYDGLTQIYLGLLFAGAAVLCGAISYHALNRAGLAPIALWGNVAAVAFFAPLIGIGFVLYVYAS